MNEALKDMAKSVNSARRRHEAQLNIRQAQLDRNEALLIEIISMLRSQHAPIEFEIELSDNEA